MRYAARAPLIAGVSEILWKEVDEGWIRFDPLAGTTLLLAPVARFLLDRLSVSRDSLSLEELTQTVLSEESDAPPELCHSLVAQAVNALVEAQLIRPVIP